MKCHSKEILCLTAVFLLCGCASLATWSHPIEGRWHFAYVRKAPTVSGEFPAPPTFDSITFTPPFKIELQSRLSGFDFSGSYRLRDDRLSYQFHPPESDAPIRQEVAYSLLDQDRTLVLIDDKTEFVYYRPEKFQAFAIAGNWTLEVDGETETMQLRADGSFRLLQRSITGHYRLWPSRFGNAMTAVVDIPGQGGRFMIYRYHLENDRLDLTPITWEGLVNESTFTWIWSPESPQADGVRSSSDGP